MKKLSAAHCDRMLKRASVPVDLEISASMKERSRGPDARMYGMLRYFMGYLDQNLKPIRMPAGKRFRAGLCLILAEAYQSRSEAFEAAIAIELFHNFTLIHDDIEDRDEVRRGKPTVWKLWGVNDAINSGDAQSLLVTERIVRVAGIPAVGAHLSHALTQACIEVIEGQHLDFQLATVPISAQTVSEEMYLRMTLKKTGALVRIAAEAAGIAAGKDAAECARLRQYGLSLGLAFQMADDYRSVWSTQRETGKDSYSDIREHKRTLPFLYAYAESRGEAKRRLKELYSMPSQLIKDEIREARDIIDATDAQEYVLSRIKDCTSEAQNIAEALDLPDESKAFLLGLIDLLVPENMKLKGEE